MALAASSSSSSSSSFPYDEGIVSAPIKAQSFKELLDELRSDPLDLTSLDLFQLSFMLRKEEHGELCEVLLSLPSSSSLTKRIKKLLVYGKDGDGNYVVDGEVSACYARLLPAFPSLEHLSFKFTRMERKGFRLILDSLRSHPHPYLTHLSFCLDFSIGSKEEDEEEAFLQPLLEMLRNSNDPPHLRLLTLSWFGMGIKEVCLLATTLTQINSSLLSLDLSFNENISDKGVECISKMLHSNTSLVNLNLGWMGISRVGAELLASALTINTSLTTLDISKNEEIGEEGIDCFRVITSLKHLKCRGFPRIYQGFMNILQYSTSLTTLDLFCNNEEDPCRVEELFKAIACNTSLRSLDLSWCKSVRGEKVVSCILDALRLNSTLIQINLEHTPLHNEGQTSAIYEALRERMEKERLGVSEMRKAIPNIARLFFCGFPYAGKTTLRRAMIHATKKGNMLLQSLKYSLSYHNLVSINERTRGIDIRYIHLSDITFSLWDMAGQEDYHSFHDFMFPNISDVGSPSLFLIICNPINDNGTAKTKECVGNEIKYWMRFISSKARLTERFKPSVTIVFTRKDKKHNFSTSQDMLNHIDKLRASFNARVDLSHDVLEVDARSIRLSIKVLHYMHEKASNVLLSLPYTYACADEVRHLLNEWKEKHPLIPIITLQDFIDICNNIKELKEASASQSTSGSLSNNQKLVALTLNHSGDILYFQDLEYIVVNMQWFSHELMGQMIYSEGASNEQSIVQQEGFIKWNDFEAALNRSLISRNKNRSQFKNKINTRNEAAIKPKQVLHMMQKLNLCYTHDGTSTLAPRLFIPANLKPAIGSVPWQLQTCGIPLIKVGRRLQCLHQEQTFLTPNFFPQIQISLYNSFGTDINFKCDLLRDFISIIDYSYGIEFHLEFHSPDRDGVLDSNSLPGNVEYDEEQYYIDILIKSTKGNMETLELVHLMIEKIRDLCASSRGCQGVSLVEGVIKTDCLVNPEMYPRRQCVLVSTLQDKLLKLPISKMCDDVYCWKPLRLSMNVMAERTEHLLGSKAFMDVVRRRLNAIQEVANHLEIEAPIKDQEIFPYVETLMERWLHNVPKYSLGTLSFDIIVELMKRLVRIEEKVDLVNLKVEELIEKLDKWVSLEEKVVNDLRSQINLLLNMNIMRNEWRIPHLFHFTRKTPNGICEKVVEFVSSSVVDCYQLHFYCEGVAPVRGGGEHSVHSMVEFKEGLKLYISKSKKLEKAFPYLNKVLTLINLVAKVGAHVVAGAGNMVPDFSKIPALILDSGVFHIDAMKLDELDPELLQSDSTIFQQNKSAKQWLIELLEEKNCYSSNAISQTFGLHRVRNKENSQVSWVCNMHKDHRELEGFPLSSLSASQLA